MSAIIFLAKNNLSINNCLFDIKHKMYDLCRKSVFSMQKLSQLMQESPPNCCKYCDCIGTLSYQMTYTDWWKPVH